MRWTPALSTTGDAAPPPADAGASLGASPDANADGGVYESAGEVDVPITVTASKQFMIPIQVGGVPLDVVLDTGSFDLYKLPGTLLDSAFTAVSTFLMNRLSVMTVATIASTTGLAYSSTACCSPRSGRSSTVADSGSGTAGSSSGGATTDSGGGSSSGSGEAGAGTDIPFDIEPVLISGLAGGTTSLDGVQFVIDLQIGDAPPIRGILDTGSSGIVIAPGAPQETVSALALSDAGTFTTSYGGGITATGVFANARVAFGALATQLPIQVAFAQQLSQALPDGGSALQSLLYGYPAIVGVGMRNDATSSGDFGNPIVQLPGNPSYIVEAPDAGGTTGTLRIGPLPSELSSYETLQLMALPQALGNGVPTWSDDLLPACMTDETTGEQICAGAYLDTGTPGVIVGWPGYLGPTLLPPGSQVSIAIELAVPPIAPFSISAVSSGQGSDTFAIVPSSNGNIGLGTPIFFRFNVLFDQMDGRVGLQPHEVLPDGGPGCNIEYDCPPGRSCGSRDGFTWACLADGTSPAGASCNPDFDAALTCGDHLVCLGVPPNGSCVYWCDPSNPCPTDAGTCTTINSTLGAPLNICL